MCCVVYFYAILVVYLIKCRKKTCILHTWQNDTLVLKKHFSIYFWGICTYLNRSISITIQFWGASLITRMRLISFNSFCYYNKMHISRSKKIFFYLYSHLLYVEYFFFKRDTNNCNINMIWGLFRKGMFALASSMCWKCRISHSDLFLKIRTPEK